ncbi:hypothetical protein ABK040_014994 [Willaertia magna]
MQTVTQTQTTPNSNNNQTVIEQNQITKLFDDVILFPLGQERMGASVQGYGIVIDKRKLVLIDVWHTSALPHLRKLSEEENLTPIALIITHRHFINDQQQNLVKQLEIPTFLHPKDQSSFPQFFFEDPEKNKLIRELGLQIIPFPGHTAGHILIYYDKHGGLLFTGDSAVGAVTNKQLLSLDNVVNDRSNSSSNSEDLNCCHLPPEQFTDDMKTLKENWRGKTLPHFENILPSHGRPFLNVRDREEWNRILAPLMQQ